jgi:hypothetical protein
MTIDYASAEAILTPAEILESAITALSDRYSLAYVDYRDELDADQVAQILSGHWDSVAERMWEGWADQRWTSTMEIMKEVCADLADDDNPDPLSILRRDDDCYDALRWAIEERDDSDIMRDLIRNTPRMLFRYSLNLDVGSLYDGNDETEEAKAIAEAAGIDYETNRAALATILGNSSGGSLYVLWYGDAQTLVDPTLSVEWRDETFTIAWENPSLLVLNGWEGSGYAESIVGTVTVPFDPKALRVDSASGGGYGWNDVAGVYCPAYECPVTFTKQ